MHFSYTGTVPAACSSALTQYRARPSVAQLLMLYSYTGTVPAACSSTLTQHRARPSPAQQLMLSSYTGTVPAACSSAHTQYRARPSLAQQLMHSGYTGSYALYILQQRPRLVHSAAFTRKATDAFQLHRYLLVLRIRIGSGIWDPVLF
jgi:hypothetical protein